MLIVLSRFNWQKEAQRAAAVLEKVGSGPIDGGNASSSSAADGGLDAAAAEAGAAGLGSEDSAALLSATKQGGRSDRKPPGSFAALHVAGQDER